MIDDVMDLDEQEQDEMDEPNVTPVVGPPYRFTKGKYKGLTLPRSLGVKPSAFEKIEALKRAILADPDFRRHASVIAQAFTEVRAEKEAAKAALSEATERETALILLMVEQFEIEGISDMGIAGVGKIRVQPEPHAVIFDKEAFRLWCLKNGYEQSMHLAWGTANKDVKEMLIAGQPEPDGVTTFMRPKIVYTKEK